MTPAKKSASDKKNVTTIRGDVVDSVIVTGDNNQTIIQKFFNIFKSDSETLEQRNRRILLNHVENAWIKGVLDASLHGAALLDLGIKQDPNAVTQYPWAIKKESTDETLPAGTSMLEIFDSIGMGRSLLILGAPGSGKTTMLLELARGLITHAREDVTQPIPMVFNLASWTEKLSLADWLAQELNNLYSVPRKTAPDWVKGNKLLLLLDGLDEVRQESRAKCVEAINEFRKQNGLTSLAVCSRSQDYADLKEKLSFEGAIEVQPLTQKQISEFFHRFGDEMAGIEQALEKNSALREMAETPLFLSIMLVAYRDKRSVEILISQDEKIQRKYVFNAYVEHMFERPRTKNNSFKNHDVLNWLSWLARNMLAHNLVPFFLERTQPDWVDKRSQRLLYKIIIGSFFSIIIGLTCVEMYPVFMSLVFSLINNLLATNSTLTIFYWRPVWYIGSICGLILGIVLGKKDIKIAEKINWSWQNISRAIFIWLSVGLLIGLGLGINFSFGSSAQFGNLNSKLIIMLMFGVIGGVFGGLVGGFNFQQSEKVAYPSQGVYLSIGNFIGAFLVFTIAIGILLYIAINFIQQINGSFNFITYETLSSRYYRGIMNETLSSTLYRINEILDFTLLSSIYGGLIGGLFFGGTAVIQHYVLSFVLSKNNLLPWRLVPFLDHCVDLIFLRRVGGGYIFIHRLLMEHFAEMYVENPTSKGN